MPIIHISNSESKNLIPKEYSNESELEQFIAKYPSLITLDSETPLTFIKTQVGLPNAGTLDVLLIDHEGKMLVVEVKLNRNAQSRREVVAQIFDYVSDLALLTADDIDDAVEGELERVLRSFDELRDDDDQFNIRWQRLRDNLRSGSVRVVIAVDSASDDLKRMVRFMNEHSDLDVRLVSISKYSNDTGDIILVPNLIVAPEESRPVNLRHKRSSRDEFQAIISYYDSICEQGFESKGNGVNYRQLTTREFPSSVHYEFFDYRDKMSAEIHIENAKYRFISPLLVRFSESLANSFQSATCEFDPKWNKGRGRLRVISDLSISAETIAENMKQLIHLTFNELVSEFKKHSDLVN